MADIQKQRNPFNTKTRTVPRFKIAFYEGSHTTIKNPKRNTINWAAVASWEANLQFLSNLSSYWSYKSMSDDGVEITLFPSISP